ncbi:hypothetical protein SCLCIDRAFT_323705 [Scleroderma citrinum Foug A]|uniref:Uncharacterized protein n=1 Tax=Scleroderma citrinum Foug A TaxID=1036808 RepID=A0A0C3E0X0_9AGAM|nr:hypothetical protein SCLCIDRAFT_323705 [Scleroderma citrinum Foug A]
MLMYALLENELESIGTIFTTSFVDITGYVEQSCCIHRDWRNSRLGWNRSCTGIPSGCFHPFSRNYILLK